MRLKSRQGKRTEEGRKKQDEARGGRRRGCRARKRDRDKHGPLQAWSEKRQREKKSEQRGRAKAVALSVAAVGAAVAGAVGVKRLLGRSSGAEIEGAGDQPTPADTGPAADEGEPEAQAGDDGATAG